MLISSGREVIIQRSTIQVRPDSNFPETDMITPGEYGKRQNSRYAQRRDQPEYSDRRYKKLPVSQEQSLAYAPVRSEFGELP